jgi:hypothetical protein
MIEAGRINIEPKEPPNKQTKQNEAYTQEVCNALKTVYKTVIEAQKTIV